MAVASNIDARDLMEVVANIEQSAAAMTLQWRRDKTEHEGDIDDGTSHTWEANAFPAQGGYQIDKGEDDVGTVSFDDTASINSTQSGLKTMLKQSLSSTGASATND